MEYTAYNFGHDEYDNSARVFRKWLHAQKQDTLQRMPLGFGPAPGPRQDVLGRRQGGAETRTFVTATIEFTSSRTYLEALFPTAAFRFMSPATVCTASVAVTTLGNLAWLGGGGYSHCGLYLHGIGYFPRAGPPVVGTYLPVLFEDLADAIVTGRDELGMSKCYADIALDATPDAYRARCSWRKAPFLELKLDGLQKQPVDPAEEEAAPAGYGLLTYKYVPATGVPGQADAEYACVIPHADEAKTARRTVKSRTVASGANVRFHAGDPRSLPTLHHITSVLAGIPVYDVVRATVEEGLGVPDVSSCRRIE